MKSKILFILFAVIFIVTALYHLIAVFAKINDSPVWRNLLFAGICLFVAYCLWQRFHWFIYLFGVLMIQQFYSHGSDLVSLWHTQHKIDWISLVVLLILPAIFVFLLLDRIGILERSAPVNEKN